MLLVCMRLMLSKVLKSKGFSVEVSYLDYQDKFTPYTVFDMFPKPFTKIKKNRIVELSVFKDKSTISVPNYIGLDLREVQKRVKKDKLILDSKKYITWFPMKSRKKKFFIKNLKLVLKFWKVKV